MICEKKVHTVQITIDIGNVLGIPPAHVLATKDFVTVQPLMDVVDVRVFTGTSSSQNTAESVHQAVLVRQSQYDRWVFTQVYAAHETMARKHSAVSLGYSIEHRIWKHFPLGDEVLLQASKKMLSGRDYRGYIGFVETRIRALV